MNMLHDKILGDRTPYYRDEPFPRSLLPAAPSWHFHCGLAVSTKGAGGALCQRPIVFHDWKMPPQTICVVLVIPRACLQLLLPALDAARTPMLHCDIRGVITSNTFSWINTVFRTIKISSKGEGKTVAIEEDATRRYGTAPLVVWFWVPSVVLSNEHRLLVVLSILPTLVTCTLAMELGLDLDLFRADMEDEKLVHILQQCPNAVPESPEEKSIQISDRPINKPDATFITSDKECKKSLLFTTWVDIVGPEMKASLASGATPTVNQISMHSIAIVLGDKSLQFPFPLPVK
ncbi:hypothetical protein BDR03DRAFT_1017807 [Suillus americanus]|nr:hypothetical protein BDR03DRAFT_1017807 [Suillus americanus]